MGIDMKKALAPLATLCLCLGLFGEDATGKIDGGTGGLSSKPEASSIQAKPRKEAYVNYIGWFPSDYRSPSLMQTHDFPVISADQTYKRSIEIMRNYGWTVIMPDTLFFDKKQVEGQTRVMEGSLNAIKELGYTDFKTAPFLEIKDQDVTAEGISSMLAKLGNEPEWLKAKGRPLVFIYDKKFTGETWREIVKSMKASGQTPFLISNTGCTGLGTALFGTFDGRMARSYLDSFEGTYFFGASALEQASIHTANTRKEIGADYPNILVGGTVWPDYLSTRSDNKNFNSPRGTEFLRRTWEAALAANPDFIHMSTWNDWCEATTFCPSFAILTSRLEISQRYLCRFFGRPLPEGSPDRPETILSYRKCLYQGEPVKFEFLPLPTLKGPATGSYKITLSDESGDVIAEAESPSMDLKRMEPWNWQWKKTANRAASRLIKVKASLKLDDGKAIEYCNLPDIAIAYPLSYADQLFYSVPLHKMAPASKGVAMSVNGANTACVAADGLIAVTCTPKGADASLETAISRNGHALRLLAPLNMRGSEMNIDDHEGTVKLRALNEGEPSAWADWSLTDGQGNDYFSALTSFPDGTWAYSPTIWTEPAFKHGEIAAQWVFMPKAAKSQDTIVDRSGNDLDFKRGEKDKWTFTRLPGNGRALSFNGKDSRLIVSSNPALPNGPCSLETILRYEPTGKEQVIAYQRGAQLSLVIGKDGRLRAMRLPESRLHPDPFVKVLTKEPLAPKKLHQIVMSFDGTSIKLHVDGRLEGSAPCEGSRSCEVFSIGGPIPGSAEVSLGVDELEADAFLKGEIVRMTLFSKALGEDEIGAMFKRASQQPYFQ